MPAGETSIGDQQLDTSGKGGFYCNCTRVRLRCVLKHCSLLSMQIPMLKDLEFRGQLRPMQETVAEVMRRQLAAGERRLHVVAGGRMSYFSGGRYLRLDPRLSLQFAVLPSLLVVRASVTRNHQFLHRIRDRFSFMYDLVSARWLPSSAQTVPARGEQVAERLKPQRVPSPKHSVCLICECELKH